MTRRSKCGSVGFLLGAGASVAVGMPSTDQLTKAVLSGKGISRRSYESYYFGPPQYCTSFGPYDYVGSICKYLEVVKNLVDGFYHSAPYKPKNDEEAYEYFGHHTTTYEDLYYIVKQLQDSATHEYENPAIEPLLQTLQINSKVNSAIKLLGYDSFCSGYSTLNKETLAYIESIVADMLNRTGDASCAYQLFLDVSKASHVTQLNIFSLNHDISLEKHLESQDIRYEDGFNEYNGDVRFWSSGCWEQSQEKVRILKLHGSRNWFEFERSRPCWIAECVGIPTNNDSNHCRGNDGNLYTVKSSCPRLLIGTFNKILAYNTSIFSDVHACFHRGIRDADALIVCGYGFGDKAINNKLLDWIYSASDHSMLIIDPDVTRLRNVARGAVRHNWQKLIKSGRLRVIEQKLELVKWEDVCEKFS